MADKTGLTGKYDFLLEFRCAVCSRPAASEDAVTDGSPALAARDPLGSSAIPNIFSALEEQLGLRLVKAKDVPVDVLVIDHVNRLPEQN